jgi:hypothetical protein
VPGITRSVIAVLNVNGDGDFWIFNRSECYKNRVVGELGLLTVNAREVFYRSGFTCYRDAFYLKKTVPSVNTFCIPSITGSKCLGSMVVCLF